MLFSIITPTYNRCHTLDRVFNSLQYQTIEKHQFEWIVIDDGSTDQTKLKFRGYLEESNFLITYIYKSNGGKHRAINLGLESCQGELVIIADSDDEFLPNTLESFKRIWSINKREDICGLKCYVQTKSGLIFSKKISGDFKIVTFGDYQSIEQEHPGEGWFCIRRDIMEANKFPEFKGESFLAESIVWNKILKQYSLIILPEPLRIYYDGEIDNLSTSVFGLKRYVSSPNGYIMYLLDKFDNIRGLSLVNRIKILVNMSRFWLHSFSKKRKLMIKIPLYLRLMIYFLLPFAAVFYIKDNIRLSRKLKA